MKACAISCPEEGMRSRRAKQDGKLIKITDLPFTVAMNTWIEGGAEKDLGRDLPDQTGAGIEVWQKSGGGGVKESKLGMVKVTILLRGGT